MNRTIIEVKEEILRALTPEMVKGKIIRDLNLEEKNGKVKCMLHHDKHPSMSFYDKDGAKLFKCFSCNGTYDIINHYESHYGLSFKDSLEKINEDFNLNVEMKYNRLHKDVIKPKEKPIEYNGISEAGMNYLKLRGLSESTILKAGVKTDDRGNLVFQYKDLEGNLIANKYRPHRKVKKGELKTWFQKGTNCNTLYLMDKCNYEDLIITEGEIDCLCLRELGYQNVVSVPTGCSSFEYIDINYDFFQKIKKDIKVFFDTDEAGKKSADEISRRLNAKIVRLNDKYNDINEALFKGGKEDIIKAIEEADFPPIEGVRSLDEEKAYDYTTYDPTRTLDTGIFTLDRMIGGISTDSQLMVLTGQNESGKSSFLNQLTAQALLQNHKVFVFSGELSLSIYKSWLYQTMAEKEHLTEITNRFGDTLFKVNDFAEEKLDIYTKNKLFYLEGSVDITAESLIKKMEEVYKRTGTKIFFIDNLMTVKFKDGGNIYDQQSSFVKALKLFSTKNRVLIVLVSHPRKPQGNEFTKFDISGTADISNLADLIIGLKRVSEEDLKKYEDYEKEEEEKKQKCIEKGLTYYQDPSKIIEAPLDVKVKVLKNRANGNSGKEVSLSFSRDRRRFYYSLDEFNTHYPYNKTEQQTLEENKSSIDKMIEDELLEAVNNEHLPF